MIDLDLDRSLGLLDKQRRHPGRSGAPSRSNVKPGTSVQWTRRSFRRALPAPLRTRIGPPAISKPFKVTSASAPPRDARSGRSRSASGGARSPREIPSAQRGSSVMDGVSSKRPLSLNFHHPAAVARVERGLNRPRRSDSVHWTERGVKESWRAHIRRRPSPR